MDYVNCRTIYPSVRRAASEKHTFAVNLKNKKLGRILSKITRIITGKHKIITGNGINCGDRLVLFNINKLDFNDRRWDGKRFITYSGYPSGIKKRKFTDVFGTDPKKIIIESVKGMLPKNKMNPRYVRNLRLRTGRFKINRAVFLIDL